MAFAYKICTTKEGIGRFTGRRRRHVCAVLTSCFVTSSASVIEIGSKIDLLLFALRARFRFGRRPSMLHIEWANERDEAMRMLAATSHWARRRWQAAVFIHVSSVHIFLSRFADANIFKIPFWRLCYCLMASRSIRSHRCRSHVVDCNGRTEIRLVQNSSAETTSQHALQK